MSEGEPFAKPPCVFNDTVVGQSDCLLGSPFFDAIMLNVPTNGRPPYRIGPTFTVVKHSATLCVVHRAMKNKLASPKKNGLAIIFPMLCLSIITTC